MTVGIGGLWTPVAVVLALAVGLLLSAPSNAERNNNKVVVPAVVPVRVPTPVVVKPVTPASPAKTDTGKATATTKTTDQTADKGSDKKTDSKNQAAKKDDEDDDDDNKSSSSASKKSSAAQADASPDTGPPQTLVEAVATLFKPAPLPPPPSHALPHTHAWSKATVAPTKGDDKPGSGGGLASKSTASITTEAASGKAVGAAKPVVSAAPIVAPLHIPTTVNKLVGRELLAPGLPRDAVSTVLALGFKVVAPTATAAPDLSIVRLVPPDGMGSAEALRMLKQAVPVGEFGRNLIYRPYRNQTGEDDDTSPSNSAPADCPDSRCYATHLLHWQKDLGQCAKRVLVGVVDTAYDQSHPAFNTSSIKVARIATGSAPAAPNWHGTGVLAILSGAPGSTTPGLIPDADFFVADVFFGDSRGQPISDTRSLLDALNLMGQFGVDVVNLSLSGPYDPLVERRIAQLSASGMVFVAAAGNEGPGAAPSYPAAYKGVIAVTAVNRDLIGYRHANQGNYIDVAAPGVGIWTAMPGRKEGYLTGTSFAAPYMTAVAAVMRGSVRRWSKEQVLEHLQFKDLGTPGRDPVFGRGLVQAPQSCVPERGRLETASARVGKFETAVVAAEGANGATIVRVSTPAGRVAPRR